LGLTRPIHEVFSRCVGRKRDPLSTDGSRLYGGRFNLPGVPALYLAGAPAVAVAERLQLGEALLEFQRFNPCLLVSVDVELQEVLDLTDRANRRKVGVTLVDLRADWRGAIEPTRTQELGQCAREEGLEGVLYPSVLEPETVCLVVFPENRRGASRVEVVGLDDHW
jgi:RES domain-containing protein